eukprot:UN17280
MVIIISVKHNKRQYYYYLIVETRYFWKNAKCFCVFLVYFGRKF